MEKKEKKTTTLLQALFNFQQEVPPLYKASEGYGYKYLDLPTLVEKIKPYLKKHNLGFVQFGSGDGIETTIFHTLTNEKISGTLNIPKAVSLKGMNDFQTLGSGITYLRRYSLEAALGIIASKDEDAQGEQTSNTATLTKDQFEATKKASKEQIKVVLSQFDMTAAQRKELETLIK